MKKDPYEGLYEMEHPVSRTHPRMPMSERAAQFAPFAALTGHSNAILKTQNDYIQAVEEENKGRKYDERFNEILEEPENMEN